MKHNLAPIRPAMTAIAAVIVLSSTPLFAQATDPAATQSAPVVAPPPAPTATDPAASPVTAPAPTAETAAPEATAPAAPQPAMKTMSTPVEHTADAPSETAAPVAPIKHGSASRAAADRASATHAAASSSADRAAKPVAPSATPKTAPAEEASMTPAPTAAAEVTNPAPIASPPAAVTGTASAQSTHIVADETLPIAAAVGVGLIALGGAGFALSRGRRRKAEGELVLQPTRRAAAPPVKAEPVEPAPRMVTPTPAEMGATGPDKLPNGFDLSRFGRHTRAAYLGPTPDNPSYSLKHRLKRASFFDQREREAAAAGAAMPEPVAAKAAQRPPENGQITVRLAPQRVSGRFGYVLQR
jgi:hypothetical protein